ATRSIFVDDFFGFLSFFTLVTLFILSMVHDVLLCILKLRFEKANVALSAYSVEQPSETYRPKKVRLDALPPYYADTKVTQTCS
ncbi:hypothetical protein ACT3TJ_16745, partial [Halomonas sp. AOP30-A1-24]|uniref:hypothetical protein n=1 Tax=Halomonas sp. AOP30-A1-24 TaxID=3457698 RepID=UPI004033DF31